MPGADRVVVVVYHDSRSYVYEKKKRAGSPTLVSARMVEPALRSLSPFLVPSRRSGSARRIPLNSSLYRRLSSFFVSLSGATPSQRSRQRSIGCLQRVESALVESFPRCFSCCQTRPGSSSPSSRSTTCRVSLSVSRLSPRVGD